MSKYQELLKVRQQMMLALTAAMEKNRKYTSSELKQIFKVDNLLCYLHNNYKLLTRHRNSIHGYGDRWTRFIISMQSNGLIKFKKESNGRYYITRK